MDSTFTLYAVVLLVGALPCAVASAALAARASGGRRSDGWLAAWLGAVLLLTGPYLLGFLGLYDRVRWLSNLPIGNAFLLGPLALAYVRSVGGRGRASGWLFAPAALSLALGVWVWGRTTFAGVPFGATLGPALNALGPPLGLAFNAACLAVAGRAVGQLRTASAGRTPPAERAVVRWLGRFVAASAVVVAVQLAFGAAYLLGAEFSYTRHWWAEVAYLAVGYYVALAGYGAARALDAAGPLTERAAPPLAADALAAWVPRLDRWMRSEKPHLQPDVTVAALAGELGLSVAELSHLVNAGLGRNFNEFVNGYRVAEVQARLRDPEADHLTLLAVALESGFQSKATFNRAFRKETGTTPSAWRDAERAAQVAI